MQVYKEGVSQITIHGKTYYADENGIIDVPDNPMIYQQGFVSAKGRIAEIAKQNNTVPIGTTNEQPPVMEQDLPEFELINTENEV